MPTPTSKPFVLVINGSGHTGISVLRGLAKVGVWRRLDVEIKPLDWQNSSAEELDTLFHGAETVISTCYVTAILDQKVLVDAAKRAGVKRFVPCDFGTPAPRRIMALRDEKIVIQEYLKEQQVPYTIIDVGFWMQLSVPYKSGSTSHLAPMLRSFYGDGETKTAITNREHIGDFVARIIADPRTLNQYVFAHEVEVTQKEIYEVCSRIAGEDFRKRNETVSEEQLKERVERIKGLMVIWEEYQYSIYVRGDNCVEGAKALGGLNAKELYPDMNFQSLEKFAREFYTTVQ